MEDCVADVDIPSAASVPTAGKPDNVSSSSETQIVGKQVVKLSAKAFADRIDKLQNGRKTKLNKANNLRKIIW